MTYICTIMYYNSDYVALIVSAMHIKTFYEIVILAVY